jgi:penicillin amidase
MTAPCLNIVYGTIDKHIGYMAVGRLPVRKYPEDIFIRNGSNSENDWIRFYNSSEQPRVIDPTKGFIVSANNKISTDNLINHVSIAQAPQARSFRISELLYEYIYEKGIKITVEDMM